MSCLPASYSKVDNLCHGCLGIALAKFEARRKMSNHQASMHIEVLRLRWLAGKSTDWTQTSELGLGHEQKESAPTQHYLLGVS